MNDRQTPAIILVRPQLPENGGAVARAMKNFGLESLRLVTPLFSPLDPKAIAMAAGADSILESARMCTTLDEAIADLAYAYGTCATERDMVKQYAPVREAMPEIAVRSNVGLVFGPERTGLANEELAKFQAILHIPVNTEFRSLNLAQSVAVMAYEWHQAHLESKGKLRLGDSVPASRKQVQDFLAALEGALDARSFWRVGHKKPVMWRNLQNIFTRMDLTEQEVRTLRGMVKSLSS